MSAREKRIAVYGLGYVGKVVSAAFIRAGFEVVGVDVDPKVIEDLHRRRLRYIEPEVKETLLKGLEKGLFSATCEGAWASQTCRYKVVTVPVYLAEDGSPDLSQLTDAVKSAGEGCLANDLIVIESSVPPGTTSNIIKPLLEEVSGLSIEDELLLAYSPERIYVGRALKDLEERYPKVVAGIGPRSLDEAFRLYSNIAKKGIVKLSSVVAAELEKLVEGAYRDVNIALANEIAKLCAILGVDYLEVRKAANSQPFCHLHLPGVGVGGYCIPVYPRFLIHVAKGKGLTMPILELARKINTEMPSYVARLVDVAAREIRASRPKVSILGLAFRGGIDDTRLSPTYDLIDHLLKKGYEIQAVHDPYVESDALLIKLGIPLVKSLRKAIRNTDIIVIATDHPQYRNLKLTVLKNLSGKERVGIVDGRLIIQDWRSPPPGVVYLCVGRPLSRKLRFSS